jgi:hypothetical protein
MSIAQFGNKRQGEAAARVIANLGLADCVPELEAIHIGKRLGKRSTGKPAPRREASTVSSSTFSAGRGEEAPGARIEADAAITSAHSDAASSRPASPSAEEGGDGARAAAAAVSEPDTFTGRGLDADAERLSWMLTHLHIITRDGYAHPFRIVATIPLGGEADPDTRIESKLADSSDAYEPAAPPAGSKSLKRGGNGIAILKRRAATAEADPAAAEADSAETK